MIFAHAFIGLIIGYVLTSDANNQSSRLKINISRWNLIIFISAIIGSIFPDFDFIFAILLNDRELHRHLLTHSLIPYTIAIVIFLLVHYFKTKNVKAKKNSQHTTQTFRIFKTSNLSSQIFLAFLVGAVIHIFADMIATPVYLFEPLYNKGFVLFRFHAKETDGLQKYIFSHYMLTEISLIILGMILLIKRFINCKKELAILLGLLSIILVSAIIVLIPYY